MAARPLGPLWDMAFDERDLMDPLESGDRQTAFNIILELLSRALRPTVMVIDDVHWADDATLDLIKFVGRRIDRTRGLLVLTYRDGEVPGDHPLRVAFGDLPHGLVARIPLAPLTEKGVEELAGEGVDAKALWEVTRGNPFFVSEAVAASEETVPLSIRDAVNARVQRLSEEARALVELTSVTPSRISLSVVKSVLGDVAEAVAECEEAGILELDADSLRFRHELARRAVEGDLPAITRRRLNLACLDACESLGFDRSLCAHHAREAEDAESIVRILPEAARRASEMESHAEARTTLRALEPYLDRMSPVERADHYDSWAYEEYLASDRGLELAEKGLEIRRELDNPAALANSLLVASRLAWTDAKRRLAHAYAEEAADVAEAVGGEDLAITYATLSQLAMLGGFKDEAVNWAEKALALVGDEDSQVRARVLNNIGASKMMTEPGTGREELVESKRMAAVLGLAHEGIRACVNLAETYLDQYQLDEARRWIDEGLGIAGDAEMPSWESHLHFQEAVWHWMRGEWYQAESIANSVIELGSYVTTTRIPCSILLARLAVRQGLDQTGALLGDALERADLADEAQYLGPAYSASTESAWLGGDVASERLARAEEVMEWCFDHGASFSAGEIGQWLTLLGVAVELPAQAPDPHRLLLDGEWAEAAAWWKAHGLPYEEAVALSQGDVDAQLQALEILDHLGAVPLANRVRHGLQEAGVKDVPRGPQKATRESPLGLTARQTDVLDLLTEGLTNAEIADRLFISTRTVDHHVSAILTRLGASNGSEAAELAQEMADTA